MTAYSNKTTPFTYSGQTQLPTESFRDCLVIELINYNLLKTTTQLWSV